jgi:predicted ATPase
VARFLAAVNGNSVHTRSEVASVAGTLVGRKTELDRLRGFLGRVLCGEWQLVFVTGEPGIGKTALVDEFRRQAAAENQGLRIARGQCVDGYGGKEPYPMLEALGQLFRGAAADSTVQVLAAHAPTWLAQFPP